MLSSFAPLFARLFKPIANQAINHALRYAKLPRGLAPAVAAPPLAPAIIGPHPLNQIGRQLPLFRILTFLRRSHGLFFMPIQVLFQSMPQYVALAAIDLAVHVEHVALESEV